MKLNPFLLKDGPLILVKIFIDVPGVPKKMSRVFNFFSKNARSRNWKLGYASNRFLNEDSTSTNFNLVKCVFKVLEANRQWKISLAVSL